MPDYLIGGSPAIKRIKASLTKLSADSSPLVIIGEPGVGKSLLSSRIHAHSLLKDRELETVNFKILSERDKRIRLLGGCPPELPTTRRSVLELPTTVVIKHIDYASRFLQDRLTAAILNRTIARLGTKEQRPIRCRLIFVLNESLMTSLKASRLSVGLVKLLAKYPCIEIPPLKKRKQDIPELAQHFFTQFQIEHHKKIDRRFIELLRKHKWMMNILELKAFIRSFYYPPDDVAIRQMDRIEQAKMDMMIEEGKEFSLKSSILRIEQAVAKKALNRNQNCKTKTAQEFGITDFTLRQLVKS